MSDPRPGKRTSPGDDQLWIAVSALVVLLTVIAVWIIGWLSATFVGRGAGSPARWLLEPGPNGRWSLAATGWFVLLAIPVAAFAWWVVRMIRQVTAGRDWMDRFARDMTTRKEMQDLNVEAVAADTERLGAQRAGYGISLGKAILDRQWKYGTYEWCQVWIMGPRAGKTRSVAVPQLIEHRGAAVATSNKRDIVYLTRGPRSELGKVWIFDPQNIYREKQRFWWNPLSFVTDLEKAAKLATIWRDSRTATDMSPEDPYFGPEAQALLEGLIMAAAIGKEPVTVILKWLNFPDGDVGLSDPVKILREGGFEEVADDVKSVRDLTPEQRDGIYGGARTAVRWTRNPKYKRWVVEPDDPTIVEFSAPDFVRSTQTIYLLSKDGPGSARALVGALTVAIHAAGMDLAEENLDRVPTPILYMLDECANICRWGELPSLFSYSGSQGQILVVILQSDAQGRTTWGDTGFTQMWSAANVAVAGRGLRDEKHLSGLAQLVGDRQRYESSRSSGPGHHSTSTSLKDERIFNEADLMAMSTGRAILMVSGKRSILLELVDLSRRRYADKITASIEAFKAPWMEREDEKLNEEREEAF